MPRLGHMIIDGLALMMAGVCLISVVLSYERNLPGSGPQLLQVSGADENWLDPITTGSITPKAKAPATPHAEPRIEEATQSTIAGDRVWVDPPRQPSAASWADPAIDRATGLRIPQL